MASEYVKNFFQRSIEVKQGVISQPAVLASLSAIVDCTVDCYKSGGKLLFCGNGGSCSDAIHLASECLVRLRSSVNREPLSAIALSLDPGALTAYGNDFSYEGYFEDMVKALGNKGDVLFCLTTSGKSKNIIRAAQAAKAKGIKVVGFLGSGGGPIAPLCDIAFIVPSDVTAHVQESHITAGHAILHEMEDRLLADGVIKIRA
jgi:D-sedoheptulose 7-phosphate isomerase